MLKHLRPNFRLDFQQEAISDAIAFSFVFVCGLFCIQLFERHSTLTACLFVGLTALSMYVTPHLLSHKLFVRPKFHAADMMQDRYFLRMLQGQLIFVLGVVVIAFFGTLFTLDSVAPPSEKLIETYKTPDGSSFKIARVAAFEREPAGSSSVTEIDRALASFRRANELMAKRDYSDAAAKYHESILALPTLSAYLNLQVSAYCSSSSQDSETAFADGRKIAQSRATEGTSDSETSFETALAKQFEVGLLLNAGMIYANEHKTEAAYEALNRASQVSKEINDDQAYTVANSKLRELQPTLEIAISKNAVPVKQSIEVIHNILVRARDHPKSAAPDVRLASQLFENIRPRVQIAESGELRSLREVLIQISDDSPEVAPAYWRLASELVSYPYVNNMTNFAQGRVPSCPTIPPTLKDAIIANCELTLDGHVFQGVSFRHVLVRYNGGPLTVENVTFDDCHFELKISRPPPPSGRDLGRMLLASSDRDRILHLG